MKKQIKHIVYLGVDGFPIGLAEIQKVKLVSNSLIEAGAKVLVVSGKSFHKKKSGIKIEPKGNYGKIKYIYPNGQPYRAGGFVKRNLYKLYGFFAEIFLILRLGKQGKIDVAIISSKRFGHILLYSILSRLCRFKTVLNFAEYNSELSKEKGKNNYWNDWLFEKYAFGLMDGVIPISEYLVNILLKQCPNCQYIKIPVLCDFEKFEFGDRNMQESYFLFCGALNMEIINFILQAFDRIKMNDQFYLYLVVNGSQSKLAQFKQVIHQQPKCKLIKVFSELPYEQLVNLYLNANGLLIPLRPIPRDIARFPHKIGEYCASGNPIITTSVGEVVNYFENKVNALIAQKYDIEDFSNCMQMVIDNPEKAKKIGENGKKLGYQHFDYRQYGDKLMQFFYEL